MKPVQVAVVGLMFVLIGAVGVGLLRAQKQQNQADQIVAPKEVREALQRAAETYPRPLKGARWTTVAQLNGTDHQIYQARGTNDRGAIVEIEVTSAGRVVEVEEHGIPFSEFPQVVIDALKAHMPRFQAERAEAIYQAGRAEPVAFGFEGRDASGKEVEIYISAENQKILN